MSLAARLARGGLATIGGVALVLGAASLRAVRTGEAHLTQADAAIRGGDLRLAASESAYAARAYAPFAPHVAGAYARLVHVARTAEVSGNDEGALFAWHLVATTAEETRWVIQPHPDELVMARASIARLTAKSAPDEKTRDALAAKLTAKMSQDAGARRPFVVAILLGLAMTAGGGLTAFARTTTRLGKLDVSRARVAIGVAAVGLALYVLGGVLA